MLKKYYPIIPSLVKSICMKQLEILTNVERAKLLHELRPNPIKDYLEYAEGLIGYLQAHQKEIALTWTNEMFSFQYWLSLALDVEKRIDRYRDQLCRSSRLFSDQLFNNMLGLWSADALLKYTETPDCKDNRFKHLATGLFGSSKVPTDNFDSRFQQLAQEAVNFIHYTLAGSSKIEMAEMLAPDIKNFNCTLLRFPTAFEPVTVEEIELTGESEVIIRGSVKQDKQQKSVSVNLQFLDRESVLFLANWLSKRKAQ
jgi:hypothetical protein